MIQKSDYLLPQKEIFEEDPSFIACNQKKVAGDLIPSIQASQKKNQKKGSALLIALIAVAFFVLLISGLTANSQMRYWLTQNRRDEMLSFINARSAWEQAEFLVQSKLKIGDTLEESKTLSFPLNGGQSRIRWEYYNKELKIQGIGTFGRSTSVLQGIFRVFRQYLEKPLFLITKDILGSGSIVIKDSCFDSKFSFPATKIPIVTEDKLTLMNMFCPSPEMPPASNLLTEAIPAFDLLPDSAQSYLLDGVILSVLTAETYTIADLSSEKLYLCRKNLCIDVRQGPDLIKLPSIIVLQTLELIARPEQTIHCQGPLFSTSLLLNQCYLIMDPSEPMQAWFLEHIALFLPTSFQPYRQTLLFRLELILLADRAMEE